MNTPVVFWLSQEAHRTRLVIDKLRRLSDVLDTPDIDALKIAISKQAEITEQLETMFDILSDRRKPAP